MSESLKSVHLSAVTVNYLCSNALIVNVIAFATGIFSSYSIYSLATFRAGIAVVLLITAMLVFHFAGRGKRSFCLFPFLFLILGNLHAGYPPIPLDPSHIFNVLLEHEEGSLYGILLRSPDSSQETTRLLLDVSEAIWPTAREGLVTGEPGMAKARPEGDALSVSGLVQLSMKGPISAEFEPGDAILVRASLARVKGFANPGCFDYREYMSGKSIWVTGWIASPVSIVKVHNSALSSAWDRIRFAPEKIRHQIRMFIDNSSFEEKFKGLYKAILIGDYADLSEEIMDSFKYSGAFHILSISGLHMSLIAFAVYFVSSWLLRRRDYLMLCCDIRKIAAVLTVLPLTGYAFIAGFQAPVTRAFLMTIMFFGSVLFDRNRSPVNALALAGFLILLCNPQDILSPSFQLSFAAVIVIVVAAPLVTIPRTGQSGVPIAGLAQLLGSKIGNWIGNSIVISLVATLGTLPLTLYHFNLLTTLSPISTLLVEPFLCLWSLVLGLGGAAVHFFSPALGACFLQAGIPGLRISLAITDFLAALPGSNWHLPGPNVQEIIVYYLFFFCLVCWRRHAFFRYGVLLSVLFLLTEPVALAMAIDRSWRPSVTFLDVGQGSAAVVRTASKDTIMIDGGGPASPHMNVGTAVIAPYLWKERILRLYAVIITHAHDDHYNGIPFILKSFRPAKLFVAPQSGRKEEFSSIIELAGQLHIPVHFVQHGEVIYRGTEEEEILGLVNSEATLEQKRKKLSAGEGGQEGIVLRFATGGKSFLFPGDIDEDGERQMVAASLPLQSDVLLAPHHGSATSNSEAFLSAVSPGFCVVSAGQSASRAFPAKQTIDRYRQHGIPVYNTAVHGAVTFTVDGGRLLPTAYRKQI